MTGLTLSKRYEVLNKLSEGKFGMVYNARDIKRNNRNVIVKVSKNHEINKDEYETLRQLNKIDKSKISNKLKVYGGGEF